jgi:hypothetical protein
MRGAHRFAGITRGCSTDPPGILESATMYYAKLIDNLCQPGPKKESALNALERTMLKAIDALPADMDGDD